MRSTRHHFAVFVITYVSYAFIHSTRKSLSNTKNVISKEWTSVSCNSSWPCPMPSPLWGSRNLFNSYLDAAPFLGLLDTVFLSCYSVGLFFSGAIADRMEHRIFLAIGMTLSGIFLFLFGFISECFQLYNKTYYIIFWSLEGFTQSICFPTSVAIITNWFTKSNRGMIVGIWASCAAFGNMLGNVISMTLLEYGYEYVFLCNSLFLLCCGVMIFFGLVSHPSDIDLPAEHHKLLKSTAPYTPEERPVNNQMSFGRSSASQASTATEALPFWRSLLLPGVIPYSLCSMCLKAVSTGLMFWLPYYLVNNFKWSDNVSAGISTWFDVGGIIGGIFMGIILDKVKLRSPLVLCVLLVSPFSLWIYNISPNNYIINSVLLTLLGIAVNSPIAIITTLVGADLGKQEAVGTNNVATGSTVGIIDGAGSLGSSVVQYPIAVIGQVYGWNWVFVFLILLIILSILCILPVFYSEVKNHACTRHMINKVMSFFNKSKVLEDDDS